MQFHKVTLTFLLIFLICCTISAFSSRLHNRGRPAAPSYHIFPLYRRKLNIHGRSATTSDVPSEATFDNTSALTSNPTNGEGRDLMKKFLMFKSLFYQEKSAPTKNNIIVITQPATPTTTTTTSTTPPATAPSTTTGATTTTAAGSPTATAAPRDTENYDEDELGIKSPLLDDTIQKLDNSKPEEIVQQLLKQNKPKRIKKYRVRNKNPNRKPLNQKQKNLQRKRRLRKRNNARKRLQQQLNQSNNVESIISNLNSPKKPNQNSNNNSSSNNKNNIINSSSNNNNAPGILNLNTNMRLQNIMNAFRKQTPIIYNY